METETVKRGSKLKMFVTGVATLTLAFGNTFIATSGAQAADIGSQLTEEQSTVTGPELGTLSWGDTYQAESRACVPNSAQPGDTWTWSMPAQVQWQREVTLNHNGTPAIDVVIENGTATFTLRPEMAGLQSRCINFNFSGSLRNDQSLLGQQTLEVRGGTGQLLGSKVITVRKPPFHELPTDHWKQIFFNREDQCRQQTDNCLTTAITIKAGDQGLVTVVDNAQPSWKFKCDAVELRHRNHTTETENPVNDRLQDLQCSADSLSFKINTSGLPDNESYRLTIGANAVVPGETGLVTYQNVANITDKNNTKAVDANTQSSYVGGYVTGASVKIRKTDAQGNDANTQDTGVELLNGTTKLNYAIVNNGDQNLKDIMVTDTVEVGNATVNNLSCVFPDNSTGTQWAGPFKPKQSFNCTAELTGVVGHHKNTAAVAGIAVNGEPVRSSDPYWARNKKKVSVGNQVWFDANGNGLYEEGQEEGIDGVTLTISRTDGQPVTDYAGSPYTTEIQSANGGKYLFENLPALPEDVRYEVTVSNVPAEYTPTQADVGGAEGVDNNSSTGKATSTRLVNNDDQDLTLDFGFVKHKKVSIGNQVWFDADHNGLFDNNEQGIENVKLTVTRADGNPVTNYMGQELTEDQRSTMTNAQGQYLFENLAALPAGTKYVVTVSEVPAQYEPTKADVGGVEGVDNNSSTGTATSTDLTTDGAQDLTLDFGFIEKPKVSIGNQVWFDADHNGLFDNGEKGLENIKLTVTRSDNNPVTNFKGEELTEDQRSTMTNAQGQYLFENLAALPAGTKYVVTVSEVPAQYEPTKADVGGVEGVDNNSSTGTATSTDLTTDGAQDLTLDFGFVYKKVSIGNQVWFDKDNDGLFNNNEKGIANAQLTVTRTDGQPVVDFKGQPYSVKTTTNADGQYLFADLSVLPADVKYVVTIADIPGYLPTKADVGGVEGVDNNSSTGTATSTALVDNNAADLTLDFGFVKKKVSVGDYVWWDVNRDGQQSDDEKPVSDVTVKLFNEAGEEIGTTKTDENGFYSFVDLEAGDKYTVKFIAPEGASFTTQEEGDEATDSNPNLEGVAEFTAPLDGQNKADKPDLPTIDAGIVKLNLVLVKKLETTELVYPGDEVVFTLTPSNEGPVDALAGWSVTDVLPAGLTLVDISGEGYTCDKETATCIAADILAAGETGNAITVKAKVDADVKGSLHNVAYVAPAPEEIVETNPLGDKPVTGTNTDETSTDNDSQALVKVIEVIVPEKPGLAKTGGDMPLVGAGVAAMLLAAGGALVAARRSKRA